jgi:mRNA-degrading endonuclease YafQ of YafQ-DinJ toxin-antitoxin module
MRQPAYSGQFKRDVKLADRRGFRDLHIEPDWLLLYSLDGDVVR